MQSTALRIETTILPNLSAPRCRHIRGVQQTINELAVRFGLDPLSAELAALGHDIERERTTAELSSLVQEHGIVCASFEMENPILLHGPVAAWRIAQWNPLVAPAALSAIRHHTLGDPSLDAIGLALYVADYTEPNRPFLSELQRGAIHAATSLAAMVMLIVDHARDRFGAIHERTAAMVQHLEQHLEQL